MKKTLVALAILAASGASFAQATITGSYAFGYSQSSGGGVAQSSGLGTDTADINFAASEDIGGGLSASAKMGISGAARGTAVTGNTATVGIKNAAFGVTLGQIESTNGLLAIGSSGAAGFGMDGKAISGSSNIDVLALAVPVTPALTLGASYVDRGTGGFGLGVGSTGATAGGQPSFTIGATYAAGALAVKLDATNWSRVDDATVTSAGITASGYNKNRFRISAGYDMGVARLSGGFSSLNTSTSITNTETLLGVKVPVGAVTIGLDYAMGTVTGQDDTSGYSLGVGYDLSKRTNIGMSYANWKNRGTGTTGVLPVVAATENNNAFRVLVAHSF
jgi:Gram-negative porin